MTDRELMQQALDALETKGEHHPRVYQAIAALRDRLAQSEQKPFEYWNAVEGWVKVDEVREHFESVGCGTIYKTEGEGRVPLYTNPRRPWVGLTDDDYETLSQYAFVEVIEKVEALLKEKNGG